MLFSYWNLNMYIKTKTIILLHCVGEKKQIVNISVMTP